MTRSLSRIATAYLSVEKSTDKLGSGVPSVTEIPGTHPFKAPLDGEAAQARTELPWPLSHGQQVCLHLVFAHMTSKEIARELDISPHTVDQRLRMAIRIMGVGTRFQAARTFVSFLNTIPKPDADAYQPLIYQPAGFQNPRGSDTLRWSASSLTMPASRDGGSGDGMIAHVSGTGIGTGKGIGVSALPGPAITVPKTRLSVFKRFLAQTERPVRKPLEHSAERIGRLTRFGWTMILMAGLFLLLQSAITLVRS